MSKELKHTSVLLDEAIEGLDIKEGGIYVDATLGGGGHSSVIAEKIGENGLLIGIDQDPFALDYAKKRLESSACEMIFVNDNFSNLKEILNELGISQVDGILYDLGVSSFQLDQGDRGFSYHEDGPLDMRMDSNSGFSARDIVNSYSKEELIRVLRDYGEERYAPRIAERIIRERKEKPIETTAELRDIIISAYPKKARYKKKHPARKTFQALRIEVNSELKILKPALDEAVDFLKPGGRMAVISFHSLEDRIVKNFFRDEENPCTCPPELPYCVCGKVARLKRVNRKPITAAEDETDSNPRARSAKLRIAEKPS